ncbi:MAG: phenylalanine--tRNA ligase subunit beta [Vicinamibacterales bacterium]
MKILLSWLREFVDVPGTADDIASTMSLRGFNVEGVDPTGDGDAIIDFEVTANRPDCMSVAGMAREIATAYGLQVRRPAARSGDWKADPVGRTGPGLALVSLSPVDAGEIAITIDATDLCPRYAGAVADVTVGPSPAWMQARLTAAGVRPISNIVDITNYVLIELGQPMHAFDMAKVSSAHIVVRRAHAQEVIRTLDGQERKLTADMLVIADPERALAIAGVMGGASSEVSAGATSVLFESAYFNPLSVRRTSKALGLKTEASMRFERGSDPRLPVMAMERACALLEMIGAGHARGTVVDRYPTRIEPVGLRLRRQRIAAVLGTTVTDDEITRILGSLAFALRDADDGWDVTVPTRRVDVVREIDLIEEVARHFGLDRIPVSFPAVTQAPARVDPRVTRARQLRNVLNGSGFSEAITFGFISAQAAAPFAADADVAPIANPLSETFAVLRPSSLPGLLDAVAHNRRREQRDVRLFEVGACFTRAAGERRRVACAWTGGATPEHWGGGHRVVDFFDIKAVAERIGQAIGLDTAVEAHAETWLVAGRSARLMHGDAVLGCFGLLARDVAERHGIPSGDEVYVVDIDLDAAEQHAARADRRVTPLPRYPSVVRDISVLVSDTLSSAAIRSTIRSSASAALVEVREFDRYQGKGIVDGKVSLSFHLTFRSADRTLTDAEVQHEMDDVLAALIERHNALQR